MKCSFFGKIKAGNRQVYNEYDSKSRVVYQEDAKGGKYTLECLEDHTLVTDAEGISSGIWFNEQKRTIRETDGYGGEYLYSYDEAGNLTKTIHADGGEEKKEYDAQGHLIKETDPLGYEMVYTYDENGVVILRTDRHAFQPAGTVRGDAREPQSLNRYAYVQNNPVMYEDPSGESFLPAVIGA